MKNNNEKTDLRVRRTYKLLSDALISLMKVKPFEKISVMDICNEAMVHRATFYTHFEDKYQLLKYCMRELELAFDESTPTENTIQGYKEYYTDILRRILDTVAQQKDLYSMIFKKNKTDSMLTNFQDFISKKIAENMEKAKQSGVDFPVPPEILSNFYAAGCISVAEWWLSTDMNMPVEELVQYMNLLISKF